MKKVLSFGLFTISVVMVIEMIRWKHEVDVKKLDTKLFSVFDSINDNPIGI